MDEGETNVMLMILTDDFTFAEFQKHKKRCETLLILLVDGVKITSHCYLRIENAEGNVLIAVYLFICMRVTRITQQVLNRIA